MQLTRKSHLSRMKIVSNMEMYICKAMRCTREEMNKELLDAARMSQNSLKEVLPRRFHGVISSKIIHPITPTIKEKSTHQIQLTKLVWSTIIPSPKYLTIIQGMNLMLKCHDPNPGRDWHPHLPSYVSEPTNLNLNIFDIMST